MAAIFAFTASARASSSVKAGIYYSPQWGIYIANVVENDGKISSVIIDRIANGKATDADILSGATIGIGNFTRAVLDAMKQ